MGIVPRPKCYIGGYDIPQILLFNCTFLGYEYVITRINNGQHNKI